MTLILVSNRLPVTVRRIGNRLDVQPNPGGVAAGLASFHRELQARWFGWPGSIAPGESKQVAARLEKEFDCVPVVLPSSLARPYYAGFSNGTLWPLFHSFSTYARYSASEWEAYRNVNARFADAIVRALRPTDQLWIHDYHLLLLPRLIRERVSEARVGFFLHIPFPPYDVFRLLPWHREILQGMLGADLIGFHTYDYARAFLGSLLRDLGLDNRIGTIVTGHRAVQVDVFPLGVDVAKFNSTPIGPSAGRSIARLRKGLEPSKLLFSISRLDYTKGIPEGLDAFGRFLERHPEWRRKITYLLAVVPSRERVAEYSRLKRAIDERVGRINSRYRTIAWSPIRYVYRQLDFDELIALYRVSDVAIITPLRDGMNLIAKEYVAAKQEPRGVLILSEMAGASKEMREALIVNPNDVEDVVGAIHRALTMPPEEQAWRIRAMQDRLRRYDMGDEVPRAPRRCRPPVRGSHFEDAIGPESEGDPPSVPEGGSTGVTLRLRRNPRLLVGTSGDRAPGRPRHGDSEGTCVRSDESRRARERPAATGLGALVRGAPVDAYRGTRRLGPRPRGPGVAVHAAGRGRMEGPRASCDGAFPGSGPRLFPRRERFLDRVALSCGGCGIRDPRGEGPRRHPDHADRELRSSGPAGEQGRRDPPQRGEQRHSLRDASGRRTVGLHPGGGRRLDGRGVVRCAPSECVLHPGWYHGVLGSAQRGDRGIDPRSARIAGCGNAVTFRRVVSWPASPCR